MKIVELHNGEIVEREATPEEEAAWNQAAQEQPEQPITVEDRVQILEEALELLLSGATE